MIFLSIDVEASGPQPGLFYLVSVGAVVVARDGGGRWAVDRARTFYAELQPLEGAGELREAMAVHGLTRAHLAANGEPPESAIARLGAWLDALGEFRAAAWPSSFDHPFVSWNLQHFLGRNPLGHSGFDIASFAMGLFRCTGRNELSRAMQRAGYVPPHNPSPHHALADAVEQGETLAWLLERAAVGRPVG